MLFLEVLVFIMLPVVDSYRPSFAENAELSTVVFYVGWYDVGKEALEGLEGIKRIDKGFYNSKEINTVYYDASTVNIEEIENLWGKREHTREL